MRYRSERLPEPGRAWKIPVSFLILGVAAVVAIFPPGWSAPAPAPTLTTGELQRGLRTALYLQATQVESFRVREGRLPRSLDDVALRIPGIRYVRSNNRVFQLVGTMPDGAAIVYDSARPTESFDSLAAAWAGDPG